MARIHLIDGEKGGVGKSLFTRVMVQYVIDNKLEQNGGRWRYNESRC